MAAKANCTTFVKPCSSKKEDKSKKKQFRWNADMIDTLIACLQNYKSQMEYKNVDFDGDRPLQYTWLREEMAKHFQEGETLGQELFGPLCVSISDIPMAEMSKEEKAQHMKVVKRDNEKIRKGYGRVKEKVKEIRQAFSQAGTTGSRSGSGKIVFEHYDRLVSLWGGSAATEPLPFGIDGDTFNNVNTDDRLESNVLESLSDDGTGEDDDEFQEGERSEIDIGNDRRKRKSESQVPKLIDNKRKHMQKTLSAAQRDQVLLNETKEDNQLRKDLAAAMRESTDSFAKALNGMSNSMVQIGAGICKSLEVMAHAMMTPTNQNMFYQNQPLQRFPYQDPYVGSGQRAFQQPSPVNGQHRQQNQNQEEESSYSQLF